jgi:hypothetical protein
MASRRQAKYFFDATDLNWLTSIKDRWMRRRQD